MTNETTAQNKDQNPDQAVERWLKLATELGLREVSFPVDMQGFDNLDVDNRYHWSARFTLKHVCTDECVGGSHVYTCDYPPGINPTRARHRALNAQ